MKERKLILTYIFITLCLNMKGQILSVYNPFSENINPGRYDFFNGEEYEKTPITIIGVVSGESQGGWPGHDLYTLHSIKLKSWKLLEDSEFNRTNLTIFRSVEKSSNFFKDIPGFAVVELEVYINKEKNRAVMISGKIFQTLNKMMSGEIDFLKSVKSIFVEEIGEFEFNYETQNFQRNVRWLDKEIDIVIDISSSDDITDEIETLRALYNDQKAISEMVMKYAIDNILKERNENAVEYDIEIMSESTFKKYSALDLIVVNKDNNFTMEFSESEIIFHGVGYSINSILKQGCQSHIIVY